MIFTSFLQDTKKAIQVTISPFIIKLAFLTWQQIFGYECDSEITQLFSENIELSPGWVITFIPLKNLQRVIISGHQNVITFFGNYLFYVPHFSPDKQAT